MHVAAENGRLEVMEYLQEIGESLSPGDGDQATPLHWAALGGQVRIVRYLVEKGLDVNAAADDGCTGPLHYAAYWKRREVDHGSPLELAWGGFQVEEQARGNSLHHGEEESTTEGPVET
jgi:hypothetical protein